ncbi:MAG: tyrosine recombinase [Clostridia bacterium]
MKLIVQDFIDYLKNRQVSQNTILSYERDINQLVKFLDNNNKELFDATEDDITKYAEYMQSQNKSNATISRGIASIKAFYRYLCKHKLADCNIAEKVEVPKVEKKEPGILTIKEVENLLEQPDTTDLKGQRDRAMLEVLYATGIRVTELVSLTLDDLNISNGTVKIKKKTKERVIPLSNSAIRAVKTYIANVRPLLIKSEEENVLFINANGQKMTRQGFWKILKQYKVQAKIDKELTPHTIRHTFAVHMLQSGQELKFVQEVLGHTDIASTQIYTQMAEVANNNEVIETHHRS